MPPKILFAAPNHFGIYTRIIEEFEYYKYDVTSICIEDWPEKRVKKKYKLLNKIGKLFNFSRRKSLHKKNDVLTYLNSFNDEIFDICFFIRPDLYSLDIIKKAKKKAKKSIAYQWDGLDRYPNIKDKIIEFDNFLVFDKSDFDKYKPIYKNINLGSNFYFENDLKIKSKENTDVFYLGAFETNRNKKMMRIYNQLSQYSLDIKIILCQIPLKPENVREFSNNDIQFVDKIIDYSEGLSYTKSSKIIVDLLVEEHSGLSFRFYEAMKYKNKIITTNTSVVNYKFFHPNNIFVFNNNLDQLKSFINKPYEEISDVKKYSFINWFTKHSNFIEN